MDYWLGVRAQLRHGLGPITDRRQANYYHVTYTNRLFQTWRPFTCSTRRPPIGQCPASVVTTEARDVAFTCYGRAISSSDAISYNSSD